tara:strand:- start:569 stop:1168 length:600 start_codon:yes stop_codon:yes gene_type:complete
MNYKSPMNNQNKGYAKESASQERSNLLSINPLSKHMSTPMQMGGSKSYGSAMMMKGAMKGDQSKTRSDYAMDSGKTDKGYKGKTGSSKGDQSASKADYGSPAKKTGPGDGGMKKGGTKKSGKLKKANPKDYDTLRKLQKSGAIKKGKKGDSKRTFGDSPNKNLGMKYDIKEASNQSLSAKARKHYAENAQAASKSGYKG